MLYYSPTATDIHRGQPTLSVYRTLVNRTENCVTFFGHVVAQPRRIAARAMQGGDVEISVIDNGIGFDQKDAEDRGAPHDVHRVQALGSRNGFHGFAAGHAVDSSPRRIGTGLGQKKGAGWHPAPIVDRKEVRYRIPCARPEVSLSGRPR